MYDKCRVSSAFPELSPRIARFEIFFQEMVNPRTQGKNFGLCVDANVDLSALIWPTGTRTIPTAQCDRSAATVERERSRRSRRKHRHKA